MLHPLSLPRCRRLPRCKPRALEPKEVMEILLRMGILVVVLDEENRGVDVVGSAVGEAGEGVGVTEEEDVDVEISISLYSVKIVSSKNYQGRILRLCQSVRLHTL